MGSLFFGTNLCRGGEAAGQPLNIGGLFAWVKLHARFASTGSDFTRDDTRAASGEWSPKRGRGAGLHHRAALSPWLARRNARHSRPQSPSIAPALQPEPNAAAPLCPEHIELLKARNWVGGGRALPSRGAPTAPCGQSSCCTLRPVRVCQHRGGDGEWLLLAPRLPVAIATWILIIPSDALLLPANQGLKQSTESWFHLLPPATAARCTLYNPCRS